MNVAGKRNRTALIAGVVLLLSSWAALGSTMTNAARAVTERSDATPAASQRVVRPSAKVVRHGKIGRFDFAKSTWTCYYNVEKASAGGFAGTGQQTRVAVGMRPYWHQPAHGGWKAQNLIENHLNQVLVGGHWKTWSYEQRQKRVRFGSGNRPSLSTRPGLVAIHSKIVLPYKDRTHPSAFRLIIEEVWLKPTNNKREGYVKIIPRYAMNDFAPPYSSKRGSPAYTYVPGYRVSSCPVKLAAPWQQSVSAVEPSQRVRASMVFDPATNSTVMFGGTGSNGRAVGDTWSWDGSSWTERHPDLAPSPRAGAAMAYDAAMGKVVLFGGEDWAADTSPTFLDTWTWDGTAWVELFPSRSPSINAGLAAYDAATQQIVLFGRAPGQAKKSQTWTWNGTTWRRRHSALNPPARLDGAMAYDPQDHTVVLFGGSELGKALSDTWTWNGADWSEHRTKGGPAALEGAAMAYDPRIHRVVIYGGRNGSMTSNEMWSWNGNRWSPVLVEKVAGERRYASMVYDSNDRRLLLFGGELGPADVNMSPTSTWLR